MQKYSVDFKSFVVFVMSMDVKCDCWITLTHDYLHFCIFHFSGTVLQKTVHIQIHTNTERPCLIIQIFCRLKWNWNLRLAAGKPVISSGKSATTHCVRVHRWFLRQIRRTRQSIHLKQHLIHLVLDLSHGEFLQHTAILYCLEWSISLLTKTVSLWY